VERLEQVAGAAAIPGGEPRLEPATFSGRRQDDRGSEMQAVFGSSGGCKSAASSYPASLLDTTNLQAFGAEDEGPHTAWGWGNAFSLHYDKPSSVTDRTVHKEDSNVSKYRKTNPMSGIGSVVAVRSGAEGASSAGDF